MWSVIREPRMARITADGPPSSPSLVLVVEDDGRDSIRLP